MNRVDISGIEKQWQDAPALTSGSKQIIEGGQSIVVKTRKSNDILLSQEELSRVRNENKLIKLLLIEVDQFIRKVHATMLSILNCQVDLAGSGQHAIRYARGRYDIILIDPELCDMDGCRVIRAIRLREWHRSPVPIIAFSDCPDVKESCLAAGANDFLVKPLSFELMQIILHQYG